MTAVIFAGPTLSNKDADAGPDFCWNPPAAMGDVYRASLERPLLIGLIDGFFETTPSVWHKEILWAMSQGIHVYGSASMGALRAAELADFGMKGVGRIFKAYRSGALRDDDDVAILHGPREIGYPQITDAMVNIAATLERAARLQIIDFDTAASLANFGKSLHYKRRTYSALLNAASAKGLPKRQLHRLKAWLERGRVDQKRADARAMVSAMRAHLARGVLPLSVTYAFQPTVMWHKVRQSVSQNRARRDSLRTASSAAARGGTNACLR